MNGKMKAIVKHHRGKGARLETINIPSIGENDVLVEVKATSICGTDVHIYEWDEWSQKRIRPPYVFGHEFSGIVVATGRNVTNVREGDFVSAETHIVCGRCRPCLTGNAHVCQQTRILGVDIAGCFARYVSIPAQNIWKNPASMPFSLASVQEPLGNAVHTVTSVDVRGERVAVIGCGPIGLMTVAVAKATGASRVYAFDLNEYRLKLAENMGADAAIHVKKEDPVQTLMELTNGEGVGAVMEMSGAPQAFTQAFQMVANGGEVAILSLPEKPVTIDVTNDIVFKGVTVKGITGRKIFSTWRQVSELLETGVVDLSPIMTHHFPLAEFEKGFELMKNGQCGKVVLHPS